MEPKDLKVNVSHYRITPQLATVLQRRKERLKDLIEADPSVLTAQHELRQAGALSKASSQGGATIVELVEVRGGNEVTVAHGEAVCRADENFSRRIGRAVATGRALEKLSDRREPRRSVTI